MAEELLRLANTPEIKNEEQFQNLLIRWQALRSYSEIPFYKRALNFLFPDLYKYDIARYYEFLAINKMIYHYMKNK